MKLPNTWFKANLGRSFERINDKINPLAHPSDLFFYVGLENIESHTGRLLPRPSTPGKEIKSTKTVFQPGDILFGKLRPNLNKVWLADREGICSTDIWVLRPTSGIEPKYLCEYLRSTAVHKAVSQLAVGANLPRADASSFDSIPVPLPPPREQQRIVAFLDEANALQCKRLESRELLARLGRSLFQEMFGDVHSPLPPAWETRPLGKLIADAQYGLSLSLEESGDIGVLRMNNLTTDGRLDLAEMKYLPASSVDFEKYDLRPGDLLFNRTNSHELVGKTALWEEADAPFSFASYLIRLRLTDEVVPEYIWALLNSPYGKEKLRRLAKRAVSMANINTKELSTIPVPLAPRVQQLQFASALREIKMQFSQLESSAHRMADLSGSMVGRAFTGELTADWREAHPEASPSIDTRLKATTTAVFRATVVPRLVNQRHRLLDALSPDQRRLLDEFHSRENDRPYIASEDDFEQLRERCKMDEAALRNGLKVLAALGLIKAVLLPPQAAGQGDFSLAYRPLRDDDEASFDDWNELFKSGALSTD